MKTSANCPLCGQMCRGRTAVTTPALYPASRRRKLHIPRFRRKRRKLDHSAASPLPTEPASLGFGGSPVLSSAEPKMSSKTARKPFPGQERCPAQKELTQRLTRANTGLLRPVPPASAALADAPARPFVAGNAAPGLRAWGQWYTAGFRFSEYHFSSVPASAP